MKTSPFFVGYFRITLNGCTDTSGCHTMVVTGVEGSITEMGQMSIFPNPADQVLGLNWEAALPTTGSIVVWNFLGQTLLEQTFEILAGENKIELSISNLAEGNYWLVYRTGKGVQIRIFTKQR